MKKVHAVRFNAVMTINSISFSACDAATFEVLEIFHLHEMLWDELDNISPVCITLST